MTGRVDWFARVTRARNDDAAGGGFELDAVKARAAKAGMPYQRFIRQALEAAVQPRKRA
ncbi:hypothetical protein AiwAL_08490 [Acidiphilium sp. AL]|uniref:Antitoxin n=1 Tax=Acidiphilium iwatense TaxID=768198 RepID=A0ABS9DR11_9PROT|nr:hypothetical protein [Acidiphilium sp. AL]MCF3945181.1 hypothetical protein [Acidiphilium iwatense]MCU4160146.1 hypothetical protein [Acidiphilium sp. AL]